MYYHYIKLFKQLENINTLNLNRFQKIHIRRWKEEGLRPSRQFSYISSLVLLRQWKPLVSPIIPDFNKI